MFNKMPDKIGEGAYGKVYSVKYPLIEELCSCGAIAHESKRPPPNKNYDNKFVIKAVQIKKTGIQSLMEVSIMSTYRHPSLIRSININMCNKCNELLYICQEKAKYNMKEFIDEGNYLDNSTKSTPFQLNNIIYDHFLQICGGVKFMHSCSIVHGDIKPQNILIFDDGIKLSDFGCSAIIDGVNKQSLAGTIRYNAPEVLISSRSMFESDIWSLGCVFYEMASGKVLVPEDDREDRITRAILAVKSIQIWREGEGDTIYGKVPDYDIRPIMFRLSGFVAELVKNMTKYSPEDRPSIKDIMNEIRSYAHLEDKSFKCDIKCRVIEHDEYEDSFDAINNYLIGRKLDIPNRFVKKAAEILTATGNRTLLYIETCLHMSFKLYQEFIEHYHPISKLKDIVKTELRICMSNKFRIHKFATNDLYVNL